MKRFLLPTLLVSTAFCLASCGAASSPRATAKRFYKAIAEGDSSRALECANIDEEDAELYCAIMEKAHSSVEEKGGISKIEVSELPSAQSVYCTAGHKPVPWKVPLHYPSLQKKTG